MGISIFRRYDTRTAVAAAIPAASDLPGPQATVGLLSFRFPDNNSDVLKGRR